MGSLSPPPPPFSSLFLFLLSAALLLSAPASAGGGGGGGAEWSNVTEASRAGPAHESFADMIDQALKKEFPESEQIDGGS